MNMHELLRAAESAEALDRPAEQIAEVLHKNLDRNGIGDLLRGAGLGHPIHPILIPVPIGAWVSSVVLGTVFRQKRAAKQLAGIGVVAAPLAIATGWAEFSELTPRQRRVGLVHAATNAFATIAFAKSYRSRAREAHGAADLWSLIGLTAVGVGGSLGGHLAYAQGAGVFRWQAPEHTIGEPIPLPAAEHAAEAESPHSRVTSDDVRRLLDSPDPKAALVLEEGRIRILSAEEAARDQSAIALINREDLQTQLGSEKANDEELKRQAAMLDSLVNYLGA
jgi:uncharacterized membrane protein